MQNPTGAWLILLRKDFVVRPVPVVIDKFLGRAPSIHFYMNSFIYDRMILLFVFHIGTSTKLMICFKFAPNLIDSQQRFLAMIFNSTIIEIYDDMYLISYSFWHLKSENR